MKISNNAGQPKIHDTAPKQVQQKNQNAALAAKAASANIAKPGPVGKPLAPAPSMPSLLAALGLQPDKLSASIVSFARFFSLPLKPHLMASIRQNVFAGQAFDGSSPEIAAKNKEALALAAAAAAAKGLELKAEALEIFARGIDPDWQGRQKHKRKGEEKNIQKEDILSGHCLGKKLSEFIENTVLLKIMNRIPGKNGKKWVIIPFKFNNSGQEFNVSMRILIDENNLSKSQLAVDIAENDEAGKRWLFLLDEAKTKLIVHVQPKIEGKKALSFTKKLSGMLEIPTECISIRTFADSFPFESGNSNKLLHKIDESV